MIVPTQSVGMQPGTLICFIARIIKPAREALNHPHAI
ncbi:hypothetical protein ABH909_003433 [Pseudomonas sp. BS3782 TE3695]|jgi:hypothetical protein